MLVKLYAAERGGERRYTPPRWLWAMGLLCVSSSSPQAQAQNVPQSLLTTDNALVCKSPAKLEEGSTALIEKDLRWLARLDCRLLKRDTPVAVIESKPVPGKSRLLLLWVRLKSEEPSGPTVWGYSVGFKRTDGKPLVVE